MDNHIEIIQEIQKLLQIYEVEENRSALLKGISHDDIVNATKQFLFHHGPAIGFSGWGDIMQGLRDSGVDSVWHCHGYNIKLKIGIQIKSSIDFNTSEGVSFRRNVLVQITESRQMNLNHLMLGLCADLTSPSQREKCRGLLADMEKIQDNYVLPIAPGKMVGIWEWFRGLNIKPIEQMREAGYPWLTAVFDSLGNLNLHSWGKGTGGDWSNPKTTTIRSGQEVTFQAIAISTVKEPPLEFRYCVQHSGKSFKIRRDWSENPSWTWHVQDKDIGRCVCVMISIRRQKSYFQFNDSDDYTYATYDVLPCKIK